MLTQERANQLFAYSPETGELVRRLDSRGRGAPKAGDVVSSTRADGYLQIGVDRQRYLVHRVIWLMVTGEWPKEELDHINRSRADNRWANLREATRAENAQNVPGAGVYYSEQRMRWCAQIKTGGKVIPLGRFYFKHEAVAARDAAKKRYHAFATD